MAIALSGSSAALAGYSYEPAQPPVSNPVVAHQHADEVLSGQPGVIAGGIIVRLNPLIGDALQLLLDLVGLITPVLGTDGFDGRYLILVDPAVPLDPIIEAIGLSGLVEYVSLNYVNEHPEGTANFSYAWAGGDPEPAGTQDAWRVLGFRAAHPLATGNGRLIAVIDSGVQHTHPLLAGRIHAASQNVLPGPMPSDNDPALAHGSHVAGIVAQGAPDAMILDLRVLDANGRGQDFYTAKAVWLAVENGADIINLSLGSRASAPPILNDVFAYAAAHGALVVAAAGNLGESTRQYPAAETCALAITAVDVELFLPAFSNLGEWVTMSAPGTGIYSALYNDGWGWWSGTSMASPLVAATAALMWEINPLLTAPEIAAYLAATARRPFLPDRFEPRSVEGMPEFDDGLAGFGALNPPAAVRAAELGHAVPVFSPLNDCEPYFAAH